MAVMSWWHRFASDRTEAEALERQVTALETALAKCKAVARSWTGRRLGLAVVAAVVIFAAGVTVGVYIEPIKQTLGDLPGLGFLRPLQGADAAYAAYQKREYAQALRLSQPLAEQGDARAQSLLGLIYYNARGVRRNDAEAARWFRLAADQGDAVAEYNLGLMYSEGQAVPQDYAEAAKWYRLAADQRYAQAQYNLGFLYASGQGVEQDNVAAHMWFNLAAAQFAETDPRNRTAAIKNRDVVESKMTREQISDAQKLARDWRPK